MDMEKYVSDENLSMLFVCFQKTMYGQIYAFCPELQTYFAILFQWNVFLM